jgi:multidrug resistance efflux pump
MRPDKDESFVEYKELNSYSHFYLWDNSGSGRLIYISILVFFFCLIISLPFIKVDVSIKAQGIIRPICEKTDITPLVSGRIDRILCREGAFVEKGQLLISLECSQIQDELSYYTYENSLISDEIKDLKNLLAGNDAALVSAKYKFERRNHLSQLDRITEQLNKARKEKERYDDLFREKLISDKEYEDLSYTQSQLEKEVGLLISSTMNNWQTELSRLEYQSGHSRSELSMVENELSKCKIFAPVSGRIDQLSGIYEGSIIHAGQVLTSITPDTTLIGEVYITPYDIGLLRLDQDVILTIDAFDYREWGTIHGSIIDIPDDFILINNQPAFRIKCSPDKDFLCLKNGIKGHLKKGMTLQARCIITTSSVAHLLTGRLNRKINPSISRQPASRK